MFALGLIEKREPLSALVLFSDLRAELTPPLAILARGTPPYCLLDFR